MASNYLDSSNTYESIRVANGIRSRVPSIYAPSFNPPSVKIPAPVLYPHPSGIRVVDGHAEWPLFCQSPRIFLADHFSGLINGAIFGAGVTFGTFATVVTSNNVNGPMLNLRFISWSFFSFTFSFVTSLAFKIILTTSYALVDDAIQPDGTLRESSVGLRHWQWAIFLFAGYFAAATMWAGLGLLTFALLLYGLQQDDQVIWVAAVFTLVTSLIAVCSALLVLLTNEGWTALLGRDNIKWRIARAKYWENRESMGMPFTRRDAWQYTKQIFMSDIPEWPRNVQTSEVAGS